MSSQRRRAAQRTQLPVVVLMLHTTAECTGMTARRLSNAKAYACHCVEQFDCCFAAKSPANVANISFAVQYTTASCNCPYPKSAQHPSYVVNLTLFIVIVLVLASLTFLVVCCACVLLYVFIRWTMQGVTPKGPTSSSSSTPSRPSRGDPLADTSKACNDTIHFPKNAVFIHSVRIVYCYECLSCSHFVASWRSNHRRCHLHERHLHRRRQHR